MSLTNAPCFQKPSALARQLSVGASLAILHFYRENENKRLKNVYIQIMRYNYKNLRHTMNLHKPLPLSSADQEKSYIGCTDRVSLFK